VKINATNRDIKVSYKKTRNMKNIYLILISLMIISSCNDKDDCKDIQLAIEQIDCIESRYTLQIDLNNDYTLIRSKEAYDNKVSGACHPAIDFSKYDLVIGKKSSGRENDTIKYNLRRTCLDKKMILTIDVIQSDATRPDNVVYNALIPKLGGKETLVVKVNLQ